MRLVAKKRAKGPPKALKSLSKPAKDHEDWLGAAGEDEAIVPGGEASSNEEDGGDSDGVDAEGGAGDEYEDQEEDAGEADGAEKPTISRTLARLGGKDADLGEIKQRIHDDAALLGNWRKSRQLGEKRSRAEVFAALVANCSMYYSYSEELAEYFLQMFSPDQAIKFFEANEKQRPLTIRTNSLKARRSSLMQSLSTRKVHVDPVGSWTKVGLKVYDSAVPIGATPEYLGGQYMIQSASSFVPVMALAPQQNEIVLDMAAAPGGKTTYIGQLMRNTGTLFANDLRKDRCKSLIANVHRMGLTNTVVTNLDGKKLAAMLPKLDRVLLDAPCTGSGIMARDPSVKVKRGTKDFEDTSRLQKELLMTAIDMVDANSKTGGYIVYSTCSVSVEENEAVIDHALRVRNVELASFSSSVNFGVEGLTKYRERRFNPAMGHCRRYYPHVHNMDGFFVAKLKKTSNQIPERIKKDRRKDDEPVKVWGEEHWTSEMMNGVVDFSQDGKSAVGGKLLNKRERKRLAREKKLAEKAKAEASRNSEPDASRDDAPPAQTGEPEDLRPRNGKVVGAEREKKKRRGAAAGDGRASEGIAKEPTDPAAAEDDHEDGAGSSRPAERKVKKRKRAEASLEVPLKSTGTSAGSSPGASRVAKGGVKRKQKKLKA